MNGESSPNGTVAILGGSGELPIRLADRLRARGRPHKILAFRGFSERALRDRADAVVGLLDLARIDACLQEWQPSCLTFAGGLRRPSPAALIGAFSAFRSREHVAAIVARGDDNILRGATELLESKGFPLVGVRDLAPELLAEPGTHGAHQPDEKAAASAALGFRVLDAIAPFDIGQAVIVSAERVIAIEGPEGTDRMLKRARPLNGRRWLGLRGGRGGVLVKGPKRGQDLRFDLPAIGPRTIGHAVRAGLDGIVIAAGLTLVLDQPGTIAAADRAGLFLVAVTPDENRS